MIRYICDYCDARFDEPEAVNYVDVIGDFKRRYTEYFCPICGEESFSEADSCPKCGEAKLTTETLCRDCRKDLLTRFKAFADELTEEEEDQLDSWLDGCSIKSRREWK